LHCLLLLLLLLLWRQPQPVALQQLVLLLPRCAGHLVMCRLLLSGLQLQRLVCGMLRDERRKGGSKQGVNILHS
jgi:hypothetical protein